METAQPPTEGTQPRTAPSDDGPIRALLALYDRLQVAWLAQLAIQETGPPSGAAGDAETTRVLGGSGDVHRRS